jgi:transposase
MAGSRIYINRVTFALLPVNAWKRTFLEKGPEIFAQDNLVAEYERRIAELERLIGRKEVEIALLKNFLGRPG